MRTPSKTNSVIQHSSSHQQRRRKKADKRAKPFGSAGREFSEESKIMRFRPELVELCRKEVVGSRVVVSVKFYFFGISQTSLNHVPQTQIVRQPNIT
jgi:hypothetical protein